MALCSNGRWYKTRAFRLALSFLTILPSGKFKEADKREFAASLKYFPLVGFILGLIVAGLYLLASLRLTQQAASAIAVVSLIVLTRALHVDGLADTLDGLLGGKDSEHIISIMKDSRVGSFGAVAVTSVTILKVVLLSSVAIKLKIGSIIMFPVIGRWAATYALTTQPYVKGKAGLGSLFMGGSGSWSFIISSLITIAITSVLLRKYAVVVMVATLAFTILYVKFIKARIGGITGDTVGALIELTEMVALLAIAII